jgi:hypothetical protein
MTLFSSDGKLLSAGPGSLASSSACCCKTEDDPDRLVLCCIDGACAEISAAECQFMQGQQVASCAECTPPVNPPPSVFDDCRFCCNKTELDAIFSLYSSDPFCGGIIGQGCNSTRYFGRLGERLVAQGQVTLVRSSLCSYGFGGCFPLNQFGNVTELFIDASFFIPNISPRRCMFQLSSASIRVATCGFPNSILLQCNSSTGGGSCNEQFFFDFGTDIGVFSGTCRGVSNIKNTSVIRWADSIFGCFLTLTPLKGTGEPKLRDIGNEVCQTVSFENLNEETHTIVSRATLRIL